MCGTFVDPVKRARNPDLVGITGIVVQETENVFRVCTAKNLVKGELHPQIQTKVYPY